MHKGIPYELVSGNWHFMNVNARYRKKELRIICLQLMISSIYENISKKTSVLKSIYYKLVALNSQPST